MDTLMAVKSAGTTYMVCRIESGWWFVQDEEEEDDEDDTTEPDHNMADMLLAKKLRAVEATGNDVD